MKPSNVLRIETLDEEWSDKDNIILHACFQVLTDCVEKEHLFTGHIDWDAEEEMSAAKKTIEDLYQWWKKRVEREKENMADPIWTRDQHAIDTEKLIQLINVRKHLWT